MHFFLAAMGSAGDVYPFIAVGEALRRRGHAVDLQASPWFAERIRAAGLGFVAAGSVGDYERIVARAELWSPRHGFGLLIEELLSGILPAREAARSHLGAATVLVGSTLAWHLRLLEEERGLRAATLHLSPSCILSTDAPPALPLVGDLGWLPAPLRSGLQRVVEAAVIDPKIRRGLDPIRARLGLPPVHRIMTRWIHSPQAVIAAWPAGFAPPQPDWPPHTVTTGFPRPDPAEAAPLDPGLEAFLNAGPAPVGITPGSAMAHGQRFFAAALAACRAHGQRAVLITPYSEQLPAGCDAPGVHHVAQAPFARLVPRLAALVHHGGIGTCAQAFAAGVPQLVCPFAHDQFDNAARVQRLGAGRQIALGASARRWNAALGSLQGGPVRRRCEALRPLLEGATPAAEQIADRLEALQRSTPLRAASRAGS